MGQRFYKHKDGARKKWLVMTYQVPAELLIQLIGVVVDGVVPGRSRYVFSDRKQIRQVEFNQKFELNL